jgi:hypothetical protein
LDRSSFNLGSFFWGASVTIRVDNATHGPVSGATVTGTWSGGGILGTSCTTGGGGTCTVTRLAIPDGQASNTFTVTGVTGAAGAGPYQSGYNHDPDSPPQNSTGTVIIVPQ